jgi:hypothetical protein
VVRLVITVKNINKFKIQIKVPEQLIKYVYESLTTASPIQLIATRPRTEQSTNGSVATAAVACKPVGLSGSSRAHSPVIATNGHGDE